MARSTTDKAKATKRYKPTPRDLSDRAHLIEVIRDGSGCTSAMAKQTLTDLLETMTVSLKKNKKVQIYGFGTFTIVARPARKGRNPRTGESIRVKASKSIRFKAGKALKDSV